MWKEWLQSIVSTESSWEGEGGKGEGMGGGGRGGEGGKGERSDHEGMTITS